MATKIVRKVKKVKRKYKQKQKQKQSQKVIINIGKPKPTRKRKRKSKPKPFYSETLSSVLVQQQQPAFSTADLQTLLNAQRQTSVVGSLPKTEKAKTTVEMGTSPVNVMDEREGRERVLMGAEDIRPPLNREGIERELMGMEDTRVAEDIAGILDAGILDAVDIPQVPMKKLPANPREEEYYIDQRFNVYVPRGSTFDPSKPKLTTRQGFGAGTARRELIRESLIRGVESRNPSTTQATRQPSLTGATPTFTPRMGNFMGITQEIGARDLPNLTEADMREMGYI
jgi:hypothetical protein